MNTESENESLKNSHPEIIRKKLRSNTILLASHRTEMAFERSRMGVDRTLMAIMRTSISLIGFGFTIFQFFHYINTSKINILPTIPARIFGFVLGILGIGMLIVGIHYHHHFVKELAIERAPLEKGGLLPTAYKFPKSRVMLIAILLLIIGITAIAIMFAQVI